MFIETIIQRKASYHKSQKYHKVFKHHIFNDVDTKNGQA